MRVGIHVGPLIAGVIGEQSIPRYCREFGAFKR
ncbi:MAG: hypothetical protein HY360_14085 [Verrucomicrobia bacterium]|nr:hypothetical protein [Verrucomicrobiota bacterium]